jgi:hypothetical protein
MFDRIEEVEERTRYIKKTCEKWLLEVVIN